MIHTSIKICVFIQDEVLVDGEKGSAAAAAAAASSPPPLPGGDRQLMAVCTDKGAVVYALPSHRVIYNQARTDGGGFAAIKLLIKIKTCPSSSGKNYTGIIQFSSLLW